MNKAGAFLTWCREHGNSPDILNLRWFLEFRTEDGYPGDAEANNIMKEVRSLQELL